MEDFKPRLTKIITGYVIDVSYRLILLSLLLPNITTEYHRFVRFTICYHEECGYYSLK